MRFRVPYLTILFLGTTVVLTSLRSVFPGIVRALRRDPDGLAHGQLWRVVSPVLVQPDPVGTAITVFVLVAIAGVLAERTFGRRRWLVLYLAGALAGEAAGYAFDPHSAGVSVAGCGLLGGLIAWLLRSPVRSARFWAVLWLVLAVLDAALRDNHGPALLAGFVAGLVILRPVTPPFADRRPAAAPAADAGPTADTSPATHTAPATDIGAGPGAGQSAGPRARPGAGPGRAPAAVSA
jgi:rhomboid protease GluP